MWYVCSFVGTLRLDQEAAAKQEIRAEKLGSGLPLHISVRSLGYVYAMVDPESPVCDPGIKAESRGQCT